VPSGPVSGRLPGYHTVSRGLVLVDNEEVPSAARRAAPRRADSG